MSTKGEGKCLPAGSRLDCQDEVNFEVRSECLRDGTENLGSHACRQTGIGIQ